MGPKVRAQSGESKKLAKCGICGEEQRRDNLKSKHFPKKHPGVKYVERGELKSLFQPIRKANGASGEVLLDDTDVEMNEDDSVTLATEDGQQVGTHDVILGAVSPVPPRDNFTDVTLASDNVQQIKTHEVILGAESPVPPSMFEKLQELEKHMWNLL